MSFASWFKKLRITMGKDNVTIRNITSVPLRLKVVERFHAPTVATDPVANITHLAANLTTAVGLTNNVTRAPVTPLPDDAKAFETKEYDLEVGPFRTVSTDVKPWVEKDDERIALTFETDLGGRHKVGYLPV